MKIDEKLIIHTEHKDLVARLEKHPEIETDFGKRWEQGIEHHPKSEKLFEVLSAIDWVLGDDFFCWKSGGDGDNGEALMYEMDLMFELEDAENK